VGKFGPETSLLSPRKPQVAETLSLEELALSRLVSIERDVADLRWVVIVTIGTALLATGYLGPTMAVLVGFTLLYNGALTLALSRGVAFRQIGYLTAAMDIAIETAGIYLVGGSESPFYPIYFLNIIGSANRYGLSGAVYSTVMVGIAYTALLLFDPTPPWAPGGAGVPFIVLRLLFIALVGVFSGRLGANEARQRLANQRLIANLRQAYQELQELDQRKSEFIQNISHELRTPLALILGYTKMLISGQLGNVSHEQAHALAVVDRRAESLTRLVNDILYFQEVATLPLRPGEVALGALAEACASTVRQRAEKQGVSIHVEVAENTPPAWGDAEQLQRVLHILLDNAIKFSPDGGPVTIEVREQAGELLVAVQDSGVGIPREKLSKIFERFYQVDGSSRRRFGGVGLGLAIARNIVENHGGRIWVESTVGQGSTFYFTVPKA